MAERNDDTALGAWNPFPKRRGASLPAALHNIFEIELDDESYWPPTPQPVAPGYTVLAVSQEESGPQPMFWTCEPSGGRVFGCVLGHFTWTFDDPYFRIMLLRGIAWAGGVNPYRFDHLALQRARVK